MRDGTHSSNWALRRLARCVAYELIENTCDPCFAFVFIDLTFRLFAICVCRRRIAQNIGLFTSMFASLQSSVGIDQLAHANAFVRNALHCNGEPIDHAWYCRIYHHMSTDWRSSSSIVRCHAVLLFFVLFPCSGLRWCRRP
jgi:hypothetical protein